MLEIRSQVEAHVPAGVQVTIREPLMPHEATVLELRSFGAFGDVQLQARWTGVKYRGFPGWYKINGRRPRVLMPAEQEEPDPWFQARSRFLILEV